MPGWRRRSAALATLVAFGCATSRPPLPPNRPLPPIERVAIDEPWIELWVEGSGDVEPDQRDEALSEARAALDAALKGRGVPASQAQAVLLVREQAVARLPSQKSAQAGAIAGIVLVVVVVVVAVVLLATLGGKSSGGKPSTAKAPTLPSTSPAPPRVSAPPTAAAPPPAAPRVAAATPRATPPPIAAPRAVVPAPPPPAAAPRPVAPAPPPLIAAPRAVVPAPPRGAVPPPPALLPQPPPPFPLDFLWYLEIPIVVEEPLPGTAVAIAPIPPPPEALPPVPEPPSPGPPGPAPEEEAIPDTPRLDLSPREFFDRDEVRLDLFLQDLATREILWTGSVWAAVDPRDENALAELLDQVLAKQPWGRRAAPANP